MLKLQEHIVTVVVEGASEGERKVFRGEWQKYLHPTTLKCFCHSTCKMF